MYTLVLKGHIAVASSKFQKSEKGKLLDKKARKFLLMELQQKAILYCNFAELNENKLNLQRIEIMKNGEEKHQFLC